MSLISEEVIIKWNNKHKQWYTERGYIFTKREELFTVKVKDLPARSSALVLVKCDGCGEIKEMKYQVYMRYVKEDDKYYCIKCKKRRSFYSLEQWCLENKRYSILEKWDYELNDCKPNEVTYSSGKEYYFKCLKGLHPSELKLISIITATKNRIVRCEQCNSFGQWLNDNFGEKAIDLYWSNKNNIDPFKIAKNHGNKIWLKCINKNYHSDYDMRSSDFINGNRCPLCSNRMGKVHYLDSLGKLLEDRGLLHLWSDKNKTSSYEYAPSSGEWVWWKCYNNEHNDYRRKISNSNIRNFYCPECNNSKGEQRISKYLIENNINFIPQKYFNGLIGLGNGLLSYDFYLSQYNLLIEYDGEFHYQIVYSKEDYIRQKEHDRRKNEYAKLNDIRLLRIPYWDFDNVEEILKDII